MELCDGTGETGFNGRPLACSSGQVASNYFTSLGAKEATIGICRKARGLTGCQLTFLSRALPECFLADWPALALDAPVSFGMASSLDTINSVLL